MEKPDSISIAETGEVYHWTEGPNKIRRETIVRLRVTPSTMDVGLARLTT